LNGLLQLVLGEGGYAYLGRDVASCVFGVVLCIDWRPMGRTYATPTIQVLTLS
jgi:hypothetical protein